MTDEVSITYTIVGSSVVKLEGTIKINKDIMLQLFNDGYSEFSLRGKGSIKLELSKDYKKWLQVKESE